MGTDEIWRKNAANDRLGYQGHSSICTCRYCMAAFETHNAGYDPCVCGPCEIQNLNRNIPYRSDEKGNTVVATINMCERCESMGKSVVMGYLSYRTDPTKSEKGMEICPGCVDDFMTWLKGDVMTSRERAYKEPWKENTEPEKQGAILNTESLRKLLQELESGE